MGGWYEELFNEHTLLLISGFTYPLAEGQPVQRQFPSFKTVKDKIVQYVQGSLPKTKKDWAIAIISEGIADGVMFYIGIKALKDYYRNNPKDFINKMRNLTNDDINEIAATQADPKVKEAVDEVLGTIGLEQPVCIHYAPGIPGPFCHGKNQVFLVPEVTTSPLEEDIGKPHDIQEVKFLTAHELSHTKDKDMLRFGIAAIAAPVFTYAAVKAYNLITSKLIDLLITKMNLDKNSQAYKVLQQIKTVHSKVVTNPIVRLIIALGIFLAYSRYVEKKADLFAAQHGYAPGGISWTKRLEKEYSSIDPLHPSPAQRVKYLKKAGQ